MKKVLAMFAVVACVSSMAMADTIFDATTTGSFDTYIASEGYSNCGGVGTPRAFGQGSSGDRGANWGFTSFYGATTGGQTLHDFVGANPSATATLYVCVSNNIPAKAVSLETLRSGNTGGLVSDSGSNGKGFAGPASGIAGASEPVAFRMGALDNGAGYLANGDFGAGTAWITPTNRTGSWNSSYSPNTSGQNLVYSDPGTGYQVNGGLENKRVGMFAVADLLGVWGSNSKSTTKANITAAGQYLNGGMTTPSLVGSANIVASDPKGHAAPTGYTWLAITLDSTMLTDVANINNYENKGLVFNPTISDDGHTGGVSWITFENNGSSANAPYLVLTPEPATLALLALGGLALLRRRA